VKFSKHHWSQPLATRQQEPLNVPSLIDREGNVIAGLLVVRDLGMNEVPRPCSDHLTRAQSSAFMIAVRQWRALTPGSGHPANSCAFDDQACEREVVNVV